MYVYIIETEIVSCSQHEFFFSNLETEFLVEHMVTQLKISSHSFFFFFCVLFWNSTIEDWPLHWAIHFFYHLIPISVFLLYFLGNLLKFIL